MFNIIKKEYRNKFKFTNFLYEDLWGLCEQYFEQRDERKENATIMINALVASYNIILYCGRTAIDDNTKINVENFIKNQMKQFAEEPMDSGIGLIFRPDCSILINLFSVTEKFLKDIGGEELLNNFQILKEKAISYMSIMEAQNELIAE